MCKFILSFQKVQTGHLNCCVCLVLLSLSDVLTVLFVSVQNLDSVHGMDGHQPVTQV